MILDTLAEGARRRARVLEEADGEGIREAAIARALDEDVHDFPFESKYCGYSPVILWIASLVIRICFAASVLERFARLTWS